MVLVLGLVLVLVLFNERLVQVVPTLVFLPKESSRAPRFTLVNVSKPITAKDAKFKLEVSKVS